MESSLFTSKNSFSIIYPGGFLSYSDILLNIVAFRILEKICLDAFNYM